MPALASPLPGVSIFSFGAPIETGAFIDPTGSWAWSCGALPAWCVVAEEGEKRGDLVSVELGRSDRIVGLGEHVGPVNCRGNTFRLFCADNCLHIPSTRAMYGAHSFMLILREAPVGIFVDSPGEVTVDAGCSSRDQLSIRVLNSGWNLVLIEGVSAAQIVSRYLSLIGNSYIPPRWAFGFHQSRWSYPDEVTVRTVAAKCQEYDLPCAVIHLDIHYMDQYKVFTVDKARFPDLKGLSAELLAQGIRLISIIDPGVKQESGYPVYEQGRAQNFFCETKDGSGPFIGAVWPGPSAFPDFFQKQVRTWWGAKYLELADEGISGFWNDMNEPSIFYTPKAFKDFAAKIRDFDLREEYEEELANILFDKGICLSESYYAEITHKLNGELVSNRAVHNLYGTLMTKATADALEASHPTKRYFLLSRSSYPGLHRFAAIWTGDNHSWWEHLSMNIQQLISLNLGGFMFVGADTGGFSGDSSPDLLVRWTQLSAFAPFFRNHAALWAKNQEPWAFEQETLALCREATKMRYALLPYIYSEFVRAASNGLPFIRGLFFDSEAAWTRLNDDQFMCGPSLLVAPVVQPGADHRAIWLPEGNWLKLKSSASGVRGEGIHPSGDSWVGASLSEIPLFLREGSLIPMAADSKNYFEMKENPLRHYQLIGFAGTEASCAILLDDGETRYECWDQYPKVICKLLRAEEAWSVTVNFEAINPFPLALECEFWTTSGEKQLMSVCT